MITPPNGSGSGSGGSCFPSSVSVAVGDPNSLVAVTAAIWVTDTEPVRLQRAAPRLGEHTREVLEECGLDRALIAKVVGSSPESKRVRSEAK